MREEGDPRVGNVTADLISRARTGDGDAFRELTEPHRRELLVHCYRMLGSVQDAEDVLQDTLLAAWRGLAGFQERASLRTWLSRIATNRCLNARRSASRRQAKEWDVPDVEPPEPTRLGDVVWLEPIPDALLDGTIGGPLGPEARYEQTEAVSLAFVSALQILPPRQLAVLLLRDVLGFHAHEVAEMLDASVESVKSVLKRARTTLEQRRSGTGDREPPPVTDSPAEDALVASFVRAWETADVEGLIALLKDDATLAMPPSPSWYQGRDAIRAFVAGTVFRDDGMFTGKAAGRWRLLPTRANASPAYALYQRDDKGGYQAFGLHVLGHEAGGLRHIFSFIDPSLPVHFGLPASLEQ